MQEVPSPRPHTERCLDCRIEGRAIAIPISAVDQLLEYARNPLPLPAAHVGGLGLHEGRLVISICLRRHTKHATLNTKAVLLRGTSGNTPWAVEVDETRSFVEVTTENREPSASAQQPWIARVNSLDGRAFEWLDVTRLVASLSGSGGA